MIWLITRYGGRKGAGSRGYDAVRDARFPGVSGSRVLGGGDRGGGCGSGGCALDEATPETTPSSKFLFSLFLPTSKSPSFPVNHANRVNHANHTRRATR